MKDSSYLFYDFFVAHDGEVEKQPPLKRRDGERREIGNNGQDRSFTRFLRVRQPSQIAFEYAKLFKYAE